MGLNPLDWYGGQFLTFYGVMFVAALIASFFIAARMRPDGNSGQVSEPEELAVLTHGRDRLAEVVAARLLESGAVSMLSKKFVRRGGMGKGVAENAVLSIGESFTWKELRQSVDFVGETIEARLCSRGLLLERWEWIRVGFFACLPLIALFGLGLVKVWVGAARERPVEYLLLFLIVTVFAILARWGGTDKRTEGGFNATYDAKDRHARLAQAHTRDETGMAVALFGTGILATTALGDLHRIRAGNGSDVSASSSSDGGSGGSSDGGGGGGCGGCGGS